MSEDDVLGERESGDRGADQGATEELTSEGVAATRRMVGMAGLAAGVANGDGERTRVVSVGRERSGNGISSRA